MNNPEFLSACCPVSHCHLIFCLGSSWTTKNVRREFPQHKTKTEIQEDDMQTPKNSRNFFLSISSSQE